MSCGNLEHRIGHSLSTQKCKMANFYCLVFHLEIICDNDFFYRFIVLHVESGGLEGAGSTVESVTGSAVRASKLPSPYIKINLCQKIEI